MNKIYDPENEQDLQELTALVKLYPELPLEIKQKRYEGMPWHTRQRNYLVSGEMRPIMPTVLYRIREDKN